MQTRHPAIRCRSRGFTLIELMLTLIIASILLTVGIPVFRDAILNGALSSQSNSFISSLHLARGEAIKRNVNVRVCKSADGSVCTNAGQWQQGWIVLVDPGGAGEQVVQNNSALDDGFILSGNAPFADQVTFTASGLIDENPAGGEATLTLCRATPTVGHFGRTIRITKTGRPHVDRTSDLSTCP